MYVRDNGDKHRNVLQQPAVLQFDRVFVYPAAPPRRGVVATVAAVVPSDRRLTTVVSHNTDVKTIIIINVNNDCTTHSPCSYIDTCNYWDTFMEPLRNNVIIVIKSAAVQRRHLVR